MSAKTVLLTLVVSSFVLLQIFAAPTEDSASLMKACLGKVGSAIQECLMKLRAGVLGSNVIAEEKSTAAVVRDACFGEPIRMMSFAELNEFLHKHATEKVVTIIEFYEPKKPERRMFTQPRFFEIQAEKLKNLGYEHFYAIELSIDDLEDQQVVKDMQLEYAGMMVTIGDRRCDNVNRLGPYLKSIEDFLKHIPSAIVSSAHDCRSELKFEKVALEKTSNGVYQIHSFRELKKLTESVGQKMFRVLEIHFDGKKTGGFLASLANVGKELGKEFVGAELDAMSFQEKSSLGKCGVNESMVLVYDAEMGTWWRIPPVKEAQHPTIQQVQDFVTKVMNKGICDDECEKKWREEHKTAGKLDFELKFEGYD